MKVQTLKPVKPRKDLVWLLDKKTLFEGNVVTNSRNVAEKFDKLHKNVIRNIDKLIKMRPEFNGEEHGSKMSSAKPIFIKQEYRDKNNQLRKEYIMNKPAFSLVIFGFTGEKALDFKVKFLEAFANMEQYIKEMLVYQSTIDLTRAMTDAIKAMGFEDLEVESNWGQPMNIYQWVNNELNSQVGGFIYKSQALSKYQETRTSLGIREIVRQHDPQLNKDYLEVEHYLISRVIPNTTEENFFLKIKQGIANYLLLIR